jgi:hypothetical protein
VVNLQFLQQAAKRSACVRPIKTKAPTEAGAKLKPGKLSKVPTEVRPGRAKLNSPLWLICDELKAKPLCETDGFVWVT